MKSWIAVVDQLPALNAKLIVPDHSDPGDAATLITQERAFLGDIETLTLAAKREGKSADDAAAAVAAQMKQSTPTGQTGRRSQYGEASVRRGVTRRSSHLHFETRARTSAA